MAFQLWIHKSTICKLYHFPLCQQLVIHCNSIHIHVHVYTWQLACVLHGSFHSMPFGSLYHSYLLGICFRCASMGVSNYEVSMKSITPVFVYTIANVKPISSKHQALIVLWLSKHYPNQLLVTTTFYSTDCRGIICFSPVGNLCLESENVTLSFTTNESTEGVWQGEIPRDGTPVTQERFPYLWITIFSYTFSSLVIIGALVSMVFTCVFRKRR